MKIIYKYIIAPLYAKEVIIVSFHEPLSFLNTSCTDEEQGLNSKAEICNLTQKYAV
jgi:hypothetical protein